MEEENINNDSDFIRFFFFSSLLCVFFEDSVQPQPTCEASPLLMSLYFGIDFVIIFIMSLLKDSNG